MSRGAGLVAVRMLHRQAWLFALALSCALPAAAQTRMSAEEQKQLEADLARRLAGQNRPRRGFASPRTTEPALARYYEDFTAQVECYSDGHYPRVAAGDVFEAVVTVSVTADGAVEKVDIDHGSGSPQVDGAIRELARAAGPFPAFSGELKNRYRVLDLSSRWRFGPAEGRRRQAC